MLEAHDFEPPLAIIDVDLAYVDRPNANGHVYLREEMAAALAVFNESNPLYITRENTDPYNMQIDYNNVVGHVVDTYIAEDGTVRGTIKFLATPKGDAMVEVTKAFIENGKSYTDAYDFAIRGSGNVVRTERGIEIQNYKMVAVSIIAPNTSAFKQ